MIDLGRVADNIFALLIIVGFGYIMYQGMKGNNVLSNLKGKLGRFKKK